MKTNVFDLIIKKDFAAVRDYYAEQLKRLDLIRNNVFALKNREMYESTHERILHALRMHDRYYVLADQQKKKGEQRCP